MDFARTEEAEDEPPTGRERRRWERQDKRDARWTKPGLLVIYGIIWLAFGAMFLGFGVNDEHQQLAMRHGQLCRDTPGGDCVSSHVVTALKPLPRVGDFGSAWRVTLADTGVSRDLVDLSPFGSRHLEAAERDGFVVAHYWHGKLVTFQAMDGTVVQSDDFGSRSAPGDFLGALFTIACGGFLVLSGRSRRRRSGSWWSPGLGMTYPAPGPSRLGLVFCAMFVGSAAGLVPVLAGASAAWTFAIMAVATALATWPLLRGYRSLRAKRRSRRDEVLT